MLNECLNCTTRFAADLEQCPHCGSADYSTEGIQQMPKISRFGGPSYEGHEGVVYDALDRPSEIDPDHQGRTPLVGEPTEKADEDTYAGAPRAKENDEEATGWPGTSSSTSGESSEKNSTAKPETVQSPARVTASPSKQDRAENSTAPSVASARKADKK